jgi:hypothetical protein
MIENPDIDRLKDAGIIVFTKCYIVIDSIYNCSILRSYESFEPGWWNKMILENKMSGKPMDQVINSSHFLYI